MSAASPINSSMRQPLRAGPLAMIFDAGDLRYIKLGEHEVIRRIYAAIRDRNWRTIPGKISDFKTDLHEDHFRIGYASSHRLDKIDFEWKAEISGDADGSIRFSFDGEAKSAFLRNRIGFCVLHPIPECAGALCRARHADGTETPLAFPELVAPEQPVSGFHDLAGLCHEIEPGLWAELKFTGDLFETEDQRNWIDASFKTFCTPLRIPYPVEISAGTRIKQEIWLKILDERPTGRRSVAEEPTQITLTNERRTLPAIGLCVASHGESLVDEEIETLRRLRIAHLRCDVKLANPNFQERLQKASDQATALNAPLELAIHLPKEKGVDELSRLGQQLRDFNSSISRILMFRDGEKTLSLESLRFARPFLAFLGVPIGAGTDADFYQLNQFRPPAGEADFVHWSMNPQVHAFDDTSLVETPAAIPAQLRSAAAFFPCKPLVVSPITLKPRFNPVATGPETPPPDSELPPQVDPRQLSPLAASWTLAVLKHLTEAGAHSVTLFETTGWRGVMERMAGSPLPEKFPSLPGQTFPLFEVIAAINEFNEGAAIVCRSSNSLRVEAMALRKDGLARIYLANMTDQIQPVKIGSLNLELKPFEFRGMPV